MNRIDPDMDIIMQVLNAVLLAKGDDKFCASLKQQYIERGALSKKQLEGLLGKARNFTELPVGKLATLEAIILKKHQKHTSPPATLHLQEVVVVSMIKDIDEMLEQYPEHKRLLFLKQKDGGKGDLTTSEKEDVVRFKKLLLKK